MSKIVNIVVDASGSMAEDDKNAVVKYLLNGIRNVTELVDFRDVNFVLYQWGKTSKKFESLEKAKIEFAGKCLVSELNKLTQMIDENQPLLFISDGNFNSEDKASIKKLSKYIVSIFVGTDANRTILRDISTERIAYSITDFMQAIYEICK